MHASGASQIAYCLVRRKSLTEMYLNNMLPTASGRRAGGANSVLCSRTGSYSYSCRELEASRVVQCFYLYLHVGPCSRSRVAQREHRSENLLY